MRTNSGVINALRPIFKEEIIFLKERLNIDIPENVCWMNRMYIYSFDKTTGEKISLYKIKAKQMHLELQKDYNNLDNINNFKTWDELVTENSSRLVMLENSSLEIIKEKLNQYKNYKKYIFVSGGKDSTITAYLVHKVDSSIPQVFNNTSLDSMYTYRYIMKQPDIIITNPKIGFYQWRKESNFIPTRIGRGCCRVFKEENMGENFNVNSKHLFFYGMRNSESKNRANYNIEWRNNRWNNQLWLGILPIISWSDMDVWLYILKNKLLFNQLYNFGYNRVGCIVACPFRTEYENILDKHILPKTYDRWQKILKDDFINNQKWNRLNCTLDEYLKGAWKGSLFREEPTEEVINEFAENKGIDFNIAKKYFNKKCGCGKRINIIDAGLTMKYYGRNVSVFLCIKCLSKVLETTKQELLEQAKDFRNQGCNLF